MSETGESSDDGYENMRCREKRRKIIMRIEMSDSDDGGDSDASEVERRRCPHSSSQRRSALKRPIISSDESSSDGEVARERTGSIKDVAPSGSKAADDGFATDSSSDETLEKCPICLITFRNQEIASPSICEHVFCFICLEEWAKNVKTCPIDRKEFKTIVVRDSFLTKNMVREVNIDGSSSAVPEENEDFTQCEICRQSNREDVMLLCDGCNQGYHMDCLDPPLTEIPEGAWYCDHCFEVEDDDVVEDLNLLYEDLREMGVPESRLQIRELRQPRVPRTRQVERVRARVYARTNVRRTQSETGALPTAPTTTRKKRKRRTRRKRRTYVVEYDVNNFDDKFAVKTTKRYIKKRKRSSKKKCKNSKAIGCSSSSNVGESQARSTLAIPSLSIFGNPNDLEYFSDTEEGFGGNSGEGSTSVQTAVRARSIASVRRTKELIANLDAPARNPTGGEIDVLSSIMDLQDRWHNIVRRNQFNSVHIGTDGTLSFQENANQRGANEKRIDEAPMYQRGNNPNISGGDRYDNQSNDFRSNSGYRNSGGQYRQSTGGNGFRSNSHRDDHGNRNFHEGFSYNIQISPHLAERIRNPRPDRRNKNRFGRNEGFKTRQKPENTETNEPSTSGQMNLAMSSENAAKNSSPAEEKPETQNSNVSQQEALVPTAIPPLAPPPWNKNLFRLAGDYDEDDDDSDCPNFSIYSAESLQVARSTEEAEAREAGNASKEQEDDFEEKEEDLVQLGDDDEIPDAINSGKLETNDSSEVYEPENPTEESENILEKNECADSSQDESLNNTEIVAEDQSNKEIVEEKPDHVNEISGTPKQGFLELYDKSDWDQWNVNTNKQNTDENEQPLEEAVEENDVNIEETEGVQTNMQTESISEEEEDRSYTPCLDEKTENDESIEDKDESHTPPKQPEKDLTGNDKGEVSTNVIDGMETELISDEDEEILNQEQSGSASKKKDKEEGSSSKKTKKETFKKISKNTKERNYRGDKERAKDKSGRSRSKSNDKENRGSSKKNERKRVKRKEIERYDVRNVIGQPRTYKDRYGRDTSRPPRSRTRSRSRSRRRRTRSRSKFRSRSASSKRRRSFSISPSPVSYMKSSSCRRSLSSRRSRCRRSRSPRRTSTKRRSRSPLRLRSSSPKANGKRRPRFRRRSNSISTRSRSKSRSRAFTPRRERSKSIGHLKNKRKKSKERKKKKKNRSPTLSVSPGKRSPRPPEHREVLHKKKRRSRTKSPIEEHWPVTSPRLSTVENNEFSWTPPLASSNTGNLTVILKNKDNAAEVKKKGDKRKKKEKRRDQSNKKEKRKQRSEIRESPMAPSKEVFASGDNILVSVSFNKEGNAAHAPPQQTTVVTLPPTREEILTKRRSPDRGAKKRKKSKEQGPRKHKKVDAKPVAIIDLDRSPFQEIVQSPKDVIVLTDSDQEGDECRNYSGRNLNTEIEPLEHANASKHDSIEKGSNVDRTENVQEDTFDSSLQLGPKTPPEPSVIKFSLNTKSKQLKARNPLHEEQDDVEEEGGEKESEEIEKSSLNNKIGPNTPPESGPCSPDAYDPFDPTKSPSVSPSPPPPADISTPNQNECSPTEDGRESRSQVLASQEKNINPVELVMALMSSKSSKSHEICGINTEQQYGIPANEANDVHDKPDEGNISNKGITVFSNVLFTPGKQQRSSNLTTITSPVAKSSQSMGLSQQSVVSKLPLPRTNSSNRQNANSANDEGGVNEIESPYSPGSDDYDDLFEPPTEGSNMPQMSQRRMQAKSAQGKGNKAELFDNLFGNTSPIKIPSYTPTAVRKRGMKSYKKTAVKVAKLPGNGKMDEDQIKIFDDLPSSAVELQVKDKFLRKLNRQERVVEEVKLVLKPHYNKKHISKDDYKEILRRAVPKICHSRSQEINPKKIQNLIEAYVKKFRQRNKLGILNTGQVSSAVKCAAYLKKL